MLSNFSNYAPQSVSGKGKTHEETFSFTRASLRSVAEYKFTGKSIRFAQSLRVINDFPKFSLRENFCKLYIIRNFRFSPISEVQHKNGRN